MPTANSHPIRIGALVNEGTSAALLLLLRDIFRQANRLSSDERFRVEFLSARGAPRVDLKGIVIETRPARGRYDYLIAPPMEGVGDTPIPNESEVRLMRDQHDRGSIAASACLGALTLAEAGLLDGREATTHWNWSTFARGRYPQVKWAAARMISDGGDVITAGGYLAIIDLALHIIAARASKDLSHRIGQRMLADSTRQRQSIYAQPLIEPEITHPELNALKGWIERHLDRPLYATALARRCRMSLRTFHRRFASVFQMTPRKYIQLKRIEKAQKLLRSSSQSIEQILAGLGVSDTTSFRRVFQREVGYSPAEFRRRLRH